MAVAKVKKKTQKVLKAERAVLIPAHGSGRDAVLCRRCFKANLVCGDEEECIESGRAGDGLTENGGWINCLGGRWHGKAGRKADIMIIGEAPGDTEAEQQQVFAGPAGRLLSEWIRQSGLSVRKIRFDNVIRCLPRDDLARMDSRKVNKLTGLCRPYLFSEISRFQPNAIILLGNTALKTITGLQGITAWAGRELKSREHDCFIYPFLHPANVLRDRRNATDKNEAAVDLFKRVKAASVARPKFKKLQLNFVDTDAKFNRCMAEMEKAQRISVDFETNTLNPLIPDLRIIGLVLSASPIRAWFVPFLKLEDDAFAGSPGDRPKVWSWKKEKWVGSARLKKLVENRRILKVMHNAAYDNIVFYRLGWDVSPLADTVISSRMLDLFPARDLGTVSWAYTDHGGYKDVKQYMPKGGSFLDIPPEKLIPYACMDGAGTTAIYDAHRKIVVREANGRGDRNVARILEEQFYFRSILSRMEYEGLLMDQTHIRKLLARYKRERDKLIVSLRRFIGTVHEKKIAAVIGKDAPAQRMNLSSDSQMAALFYGMPSRENGKKAFVRDRRGEIVRDESGLFRGEIIKGLRKKSTDEKSRKIIKKNLRRMGGKRGLINFLGNLEELGRLRKRIGTYLENFLLFPGGRAHPKFTQHVAITGRTASFDPNFQNIPRLDDMRNCVRAKIGNILVEFDYGQLEMRIAAQLSECANMLRLLNDREGKLHEFVGVNSIKKLNRLGEVIGLYDEEDFADGEMRIKAKITGFSVIYGKEAETLADDLGVSVKAAQDIIDLLLTETFPGLGAWIKFRHAAIGSEGFITTLFGRKIHIYGWDSDSPWERAGSRRKAINYPVQSSASDCVVIGINRLDRRLKKEKMPVSLRLAVHDSILSEMKNDRVLVSEYIALAREEMEAPIPEIDKVKLFVDVKKGVSWGRMKKVV